MPSWNDVAATVRDAKLGAGAFYPFAERFAGLVRPVLAPIGAPISVQPGPGAPVATNIVHPVPPITMAANEVASHLYRELTTLSAIAESFAPPSVEDLREAEQALAKVIPNTPEEVEEVKQAAAQITADPEQRKLVERLASSLKSVDWKVMT